MNRTHFTKTAFLFGLCFIFLFSGCHTLKQPEKIEEPLNYTDEDVIKTEIERINQMKDSEPVKALWRAVLLGKEDVINDCYDLVKVHYQKAVDEKNPLDASRYYTSLKTVRNDQRLELIGEKLAALNETEAFILEKTDAMNPSTVADCVKATVTIWVDKGIKLENGSGMADIVIGSGFFIDKRGYLITNHHVISDVVNPKYEGFSRLYIKMQPDTDTKIPAKVVGYDSILDLALLKVEVEPEFVLSLGSSSDLSIGDKVSAIGTPIGLEGTLTSGIISSTDRKLLTLGNVFQIDAAVNPGNSGGPLIDEKMQVQAIVFAGSLQSQGLNFAIPVEYLKQELQFLYAGGDIKHSWIAAYGRTANKGRKKLGLEVQYVIPGGTACMSGLKDGDLIVEVAGQQINSLDEFQYIIMAYGPGTLIDCKYQDEETNIQTAYLYLDVRSKEPSALAYQSDFVTGSFIPIFGMKLKRSSTTVRSLYVIDKVVRGGIADETSFSEGDEINVRDVQIDKENKYIAAQLYTKRKTKGYLDVPIVLSNSLDSPFYF